MRASKNDKVELTLDPVELGKVRFELTTTNDRMQVSLSVERADTLDLLRRHADELHAAFREAGIDGSTLSFSHWQQPDGDNPQPGNLSSDPEAMDFAPESLDSNINRNKTSTGHGLDLRL